MLGDEAMRHIGMGCTSLTSLDLGTLLKLSDSGLSAVAEHATQLLSLGVHGNKQRFPDLSPPLTSPPPPPLPRPRLPCRSSNFGLAAGLLPDLPAQLTGAASGPRLAAYKSRGYYENSTSLFSTAHPSSQPSLILLTHVLTSADTRLYTAPEILCPRLLPAE
eukprot:gene6744-3415_t